MAKKPVKKTTVRRAPAKPVAVAPVETPCACACGCRCGGGFGRFLKKLLVFLVIFALGFAACKFICCGCAHKGFGMHRPEFVNGCMDIQKDITRMNEMAVKHMEKLRTMDADTNGCITAEEYKAVKKSWKGEKRDRRIERTVEVVEVVE